MARMPGGFNLFGYARDTENDSYPEDASRVVTSVPLDEDSFYPDSDQFAGAVRTVHDGMLSFVDGIENELEHVFDGGSLPSDIKEGLTSPAKPVDVTVRSAPGGEGGRVQRLFVPNLPADNGPNATRLFTANPQRRTVLIYNDGAGAVYWGYTETEARGGVSGNGFAMPVGASLSLDTQRELWFSTDTAAGVQIRTATVGDA